MLSQASGEAVMRMAPGFEVIAGQEVIDDAINAVAVGSLEKGDDLGLDFFSVHRRVTLWRWLSLAETGAALPGTVIADRPSSVYVGANYAPTWRLPPG